MIIGDSFIWIHFPKCAGSKVEKLFKTYYVDDESITQDIVDPDGDPDRAWHDSIADRIQRDPSFSVDGREIICSFRRLSPWLMSRYSFEVERSPHLEHSPRPLLNGRFFERGGFLNHADRLISKYLPYEDISAHKYSFLRTEQFEEDFKKHFGKFIDVSIIPDEEFESRENASKNHVPEAIRTKLMAGEPYKHGVTGAGFKPVVPLT